MDIKRTPQGQVVQENSDPLATDTNPTFEETGPALKFGLVAGKQGEVRSIGMAQTDYTDEHSGAAPLF